MGERSMRACLDEQLHVLREAARLHSTCRFSLQQWYDDGADLKGLHEETVTAITYAWGYLEGAADMADLTVSELLDEYGVTFDVPLSPGKRQPIRKVRR